ncbi:MAG: hypothetical protein IPL10_03985 [Bacteroidetes bacterium]|nr:hypothetical protein [Bacteroidota bacterium]
MDDDFVTLPNFPVKGKDYVPNHALVSKGFSGIITLWKSRYAHDSEAHSTIDHLPQQPLLLNMPYLVKIHL